MTLVKPNWATLVIAEQVLLDSAVDDPFHHFTDDQEETDWAVFGRVGFVLLFVFRAIFHIVGSMPVLQLNWKSLAMEPASSGAQVWNVIRTHCLSSIQCLQLFLDIMWSESTWLEIGI